MQLWRVNTRVSPFSSLTEQFARDADVWDELSKDLFFGEEPAPNTSGAFTIAAPLVSIAFVSRSLVGPGDGVVPAEWLKRDDIRKLILVEVDYVDQVGSGDAAVPTTRTKWLANETYFDDENSRTYRDCVIGVPRYNRAINRATLRGRYTATIGSIEIANADGAFDDLLTMACDGSEVRFYMGDAGDVMSARRPWLRSEFLFMFSAIAVKVTAPSFGRISIALKDTTLLMDKIVGGNIPIGGTDVNADKFRPKNFGLVQNMAPQLVDGATLTYAWNEDGSNATLLAVRSRGASIAYVDNLDGTFRLLVNPNGGQVTCDGVVQTPFAAIPHGDMLDTVGSYRGSDMFYQLVGVDAGLIAAGKFAGASSNFELNGANDYHVGRNYPVGTPLPEALNEWCDTMNAYYGVRRDGQVTYGWMRPEALDYELPPAAWTVGPAVTNDSLLKDTEWRIDHADPGFYYIQGYGNINWTQQGDLATGLPATTAELYRRKGYYPPPETGTGVGSSTSYSGPSDAPGYGVFKYGNPQLYHLTLKKSLENKTLISCRSDRDAIHHLGRWQLVARAQQLPNLEFIDATVDLSYFQVELGNILPVTITEADGRLRYGISAMRFQVCSIDIALTDGAIRLGLVRRRPAIVDAYYVGEAPPEPETSSYWFRDEFTGSGDLSTHNPDVGDPYTTDGNPLPAATLDGSGNLEFTDGGGFPVWAVSQTATPTLPYTLEGKFNVATAGPTQGTDYLRFEMSPVDGSDNYIGDATLEWNNPAPLSAGTWSLNLIVVDGVGSTVFNQTAFVTPLVTLGVDHILRLTVTSTSVMLELDDLPVLFTTQTPGTAVAAVHKAWVANANSSGTVDYVNGMQNVTPAAAPSGIFIHDTFTGANGTAVELHAPEIGGGWFNSLLNGFSNTGPEIQSNRMAEGPGGGSFRAVFGMATPLQADYSIEASVVAGAASGFHSIILYGRTDNAGSAGVWAEGYNVEFGYNGSAWVLTLYKTTSGNSVTTLQNYTPTITPGNTYVVRFELSGTSLIVKLDGT